MWISVGADAASVALAAAKVNVPPVVSAFTTGADEKLPAVLLSKCITA